MDSPSCRETLESVVVKRWDVGGVEVKVTSVQVRSLTTMPPIPTVGRSGYIVGMEQHRRFDISCIVCGFIGSGVLRVVREEVLVVMGRRFIGVWRKVGELLREYLRGQWRSMRSMVYIYVFMRNFWGNKWDDIGSVVWKASEIDD
mmetsp:Transcript_8705/g.17644  ORF Transcript_8705/g.17644 Transcript_8705/m.17644 type:complete len:145 (+) Transcript_8705:169-603(+)